MISVIVPAYNLESCIGRALDSILAQTYTDLEIIVVNDGSSDGTGDIIDGYADRYPWRVSAVHTANGGVTSARLRGVQEASGEWIGFVDGDDEIERDMYERLLANARKYNADISHCGYRMIFPDGRVNDFHNTGIVEVHDRVKALRELLSGERIEPGLWNKLFHRSLFDGWEIDPGIRINEDLLMNYYLFSNAKTSVFNDWCPYHYIVRNTSASRVKMNRHRIYDPIRVKDIIRQSAAADIQADTRRAYINTCINTYHELMFAGAAYRDDLRAVHGLLQKEKASFRLLGKKRGLMAQLIICAPAVYRLVYGVYCRFFQKNVYS